jgi:hypothetical protein
MKQTTPRPDTVIYLGNDFVTLQNKTSVADDGLPALVDRPPPAISDTTPSPAHDRPDIHNDPDPNEINDATADA